MRSNAEFLRQFCPCFAAPKITNGVFFCFQYGKVRFPKEFFFSPVDAEESFFRPGSLMPESRCLGLKEIKRPSGIAGSGTQDFFEHFQFVFIQLGEIVREVADAAGDQHQRKQNLAMRRLHRYQIPVFIGIERIVRSDIDHMCPQLIEFGVFFVLYRSCHGEIGVVQPEDMVEMPVCRN